LSEDLGSGLGINYPSRRGVLLSLQLERGSGALDASRVSPTIVYCNPPPPSFNSTRQLTPHDGQLLATATLCETQLFTTVNSQTRRSADPRYVINYIRYIELDIERISYSEFGITSSLDGLAQVQSPRVF
jgi:hypothetical protein